MGIHNNSQQIQTPITQSGGMSQEGLKGVASAVKLMKSTPKQQTPKNASNIKKNSKSKGKSGTPSQKETASSERSDPRGPISFFKLKEQPSTEDGADYMYDYDDDVELEGSESDYISPEEHTSGNAEKYLEAKKRRDGGFDLQKTVKDTIKNLDHGVKEYSFTQKNREGETIHLNFQVAPEGDKKSQKTSENRGSTSGFLEPGVGTVKKFEHGVEYYRVGGENSKGKPVDSYYQVLPAGNGEPQPISKAKYEKDLNILKDYESKRHGIGHGGEYLKTFAKQKVGKKGSIKNTSGKTNIYPSKEFSSKNELTGINTKKKTKLHTSKETGRIGVRVEIKSTKKTLPSGQSIEKQEIGSKNEKKYIFIERDKADNITKRVFVGNDGKVISEREFFASKPTAKKSIDPKLAQVKSEQKIAEEAFKQQTQARLSSDIASLSEARNKPIHDKFKEIKDQQNEATQAFEKSMKQKLEAELKMQENQGSGPPKKEFSPSPLQEGIDNLKLKPTPKQAKQEASNSELEELMAKQRKKAGYHEPEAVKTNPNVAQPMPNPSTKKGKKPEDPIPTSRPSAEQLKEGKAKLKKTTTPKPKTPETTKTSPLESLSNKIKVEEEAPDDSFFDEKDWD